jgi:NAD(P)-dependent dehydrogenase (short-subunit alcohol dehydrogenase family)
MTPLRASGDIPNAKLTPAILDLASLASIKQFAAEIATRFPGQSLDLLINNAGVMAVPTRELTVDGYERQFATNYLGPFLLTALLYPHLKQDAGHAHRDRGEQRFQSGRKSNSTTCSPSVCTSPCSARTRNPSSPI